MENNDANQLPEVDALPDGFMDGSAEPPAPPTPALKQEKPLGSYKDNALEIDCSNVSINEPSANEFQRSPGRTEKTQKLRTFPIVLSESENSDAPVQSPGKGGSEQAGVSLAADGSAESSAQVSSDCCGVKEQLKEKCQTSEKRSFLFIFLTISHLLF